ASANPNCTRVPSAAGCQTNQPPPAYAINASVSALCFQRDMSLLLKKIGWDKYVTGLNSGQPTEPLIVEQYNLLKAQQNARFQDPPPDAASRFTYLAGC
ncbi:MAG: hypothetical protein R3311_10515, partial [Oceanisphaera sp.]|nr:hypothetical protein [Oceanisphaera sp.]